MTEYFVVADSFAAPFFSDQSERYVEGENPHAALEQFAADYAHPCGLYSANLYASADAYHKKAEPLARWRCNHEIAKAQATADLGAYSYMGNGPGDFEVNGERVKVEDPKGGQLVDA
jgi:hypothetical protein